VKRTPLPDLGWPKDGTADDIYALAVEILTPIQREAVQLYAWGYSNHKAAAAIGVDVSTYRGNLRRGLARLHTALTQENKA
jgi:DNA-directed RNA polymerase specialized sigma24 family protein